MNDTLIDGLHELNRLLQAGETERARRAMPELIRLAQGDASSGRPAQWLGRLLDTEHARLLSRLDQADDGDIRSLERHVEGRRELLELALHAGDLAQEISRTYELLDDSGYGDLVEEMAQERHEADARADEEVRETV